ncbi:MAG: bifunctional nuclease family protein [Bacteroidia bacterium]|nr:bifunctional nuclease family protein [Bacteroidia bacterium]MDW8089101.1 bifunctional nuclease family protein [Bacteroidia bacterium]
MAKVEMEVVGLHRSPTESYNAFILVLKERYGARRLPIVIGLPEAHAINIHMEKIQHPRPLTHDLFVNVMNELNVRLLEVVIHKLQDSTFFAYLLLENSEGQVVEVDCRPSDGVALALRAQAAIFCEEEVLQKAGQPGPEEEESSPPRRAPRSVSALREELQRQLEEALAQEDYEKAAEIRDKLKKLGLGGSEST